MLVTALLQRLLVQGRTEVIAVKEVTTIAPISVMHFGEVIS